jgi:hypothetical protein
MLTTAFAPTSSAFFFSASIADRNAQLQAVSGVLPKLLVFWLVRSDVIFCTTFGVAWSPK